MTGVRTENGIKENRDLILGLETTNNLRSEIKEIKLLDEMRERSKGLLFALSRDQQKVN